jgi:anti-sigma factor RsiW
MIAPSVERLSAYFDGSLTPEERASVAAHLSDCERCSQALRIWDAAATALRARPRQVPRRRFAIALAALIGFVVVGSTVVAASMGLVPFAAPSQRTTLEGARRTGLPIPDEARQLPGGWILQEVHLTRAPSWVSTSLRYARTGGARVNVDVWSSGVVAVPTGESRELAVDGVAVRIADHPSGGLSGRFALRGATVTVLSAWQLSDAELAAIVRHWLASR